MNKQSSRQPYQDPGFAARRLDLQRHLLKPLGDLAVYFPDPSNGASTPDVHRYNASYRARLQHFHLCLLNDQDAAEADQYFSTHEDLVSHWWNHPRNEPDWKMGPIVRVYYECRQRLSEKSRRRIENLMREFREHISFGGTENHIINRVVITLLCDAALGIEDDKTRLAAEVFERWIWLRGHRGYMEYNSPTYHTHCVLPLLLMYDFSGHEKWRDSTARALDQIMAMIAIQSLNGSRGGPWHRATSPKELGDSRSDVAFIASHVYFGNCPSPPAVGSSTWATTTYRVPGIIHKMATERANAGCYVIRQKVDTVEPTLDAYFYMTPRCLLACFQNEKPFKCHYYGSTNGSNLHPWELAFSDPEKVLGVWRNLTDVNDFQNTNTAFMQVRGVLLFRGRWLDYNGNLGDVIEETAGDRKLYFYSIESGGSLVYVAVIYYPDQDAGILELCLPEETGMDAFMDIIRGAGGSCDMGRRYLTHTSLNGDRIVYDNGRATVNDRDFALEKYPLCESPFVNSKWDSGIIRISHGREELCLDFNDPTVYAGRGLLANYYRDPDFHDIAFTRQDQTIDYTWNKSLPVADAVGGFSTRWSGRFLASYDGCHHFTFKTMGKASLRINGELVVAADSDTANRGGEPIERTGAISLTAGKRHEINVDYVQTGDTAMIVLFLSTSSLPRQTLGLLCELSAP
ncbi:MAG: PA14 domain-containing protein [Opitutales bacterium]